jgi:hypothetical protein
LKMSAALRTLVLNANYRPLCVWPLSFMTAQEAIKTVYRDRAAVVEEWDAVFRSATMQIRVPKVIACESGAPSAIWVAAIREKCFFLCKE